MEQLTLIGNKKEGTIKEKYGFLPMSVWHLNKIHPINSLFKDKGDKFKKRRTSNSFLPNYKFSSFNPNLAERVIKYWSNKGDLILDPFAGRTTRGIITLWLERKYIGFEVSPTTFNEILNNLKKLQK
jgi:DNA modification methylase